MRALRTLLGGLAVVVVLAVVAAWFGPGLLDWNRYRDTIGLFVSSAVGRPVRIDGKVTLQLLPQPVLTADRVSIDGGPHGVSLTARQLRLRVALGPLLAGRLDPREMQLSSPALHLPWPLGAGFLPQRPAWLSRLSAQVQDGTLTIGHVTISHVDAMLRTDPLTGALLAAGTAAFGSQHWRMTARVGEPGGDGAATLQATLDGEGRLADTGGRFSGIIAATGAVAGHVAARGPDLSLLLPAPKLAWRAEGRLTASGGLAAADQLALELGGSPASGAVSLRVSPEPRLDLALLASRLDLNAWLPVLLHGAAPALPTGIDLSAEAAPLAGGTLRHLRADFELSGQAVVVQNATATLPGDATLHLAGSIARAVGQPGFRGNGSLEAPDLRTTLTWLRGGGVLPKLTLPPGVLRNGRISARVTADTGAVTLDDVHGELDGSRVDGLIGLGFGKSQLLRAELTVDRLVLDSWLPARLPKLTDMAGWFSGTGLDLSLRSPHAVWRGIPVTDLVLDAQAEGAKLTVQRLSARALGIDMSVSGAVGAGGRVTDAKLDASAAMAAPLAALLPAAWQGMQQLWQRPIHLQATASGLPHALAIGLAVDLADARLEAQPTIDLVTQQWQGPVTLRHPGASRFLALLGLPGAATWLGEGSLSLLAELRQEAGQLTATHFDLTAGALRAGGRVTLNEHQPDPDLSGRVDAEVLPLPLADSAAAVSLPSAVLRGWQAGLRLTAAQVLIGGATVLHDANAMLDLSDGRLRLSQVAARLGDGDVAGYALLDASGTVPHVSLHATLLNVGLGSGLPLGLRGGTVNGTLDAKGDGFTVPTLLSTLSGQASFTMRQVHLPVLDMAGLIAALHPANAQALETQVQTALSGGTTPFADAHFVLAAEGGTIRVTQGTMASPAGTASLAGTIDVPSRAEHLHLAVRPAIPGAPELRIDLAGPIDHPARTPDLTGLAAWLVARSAVQ